MTNIQIALGTDMRYLKLTLAAMLSTLRSTAEPVTVHLFGYKLSDGAWQRLETAARSCGAHTVRHAITGAMSARWRSTFYDYISPAALACLYVPSVVETGRCLFIDSDTICFQDIRSLWEVDLRGRPIAAVMDHGWLHGLTHNPSALSETKRRMAPRPHWEIINSGVVLFDCDAINADAGLSRQLTTHPVDLGDQHLLNQIFKGRAAFLHPCWNCHHGLPGHYAYVQRRVIPQEFHFSHIPAAIWHFRGNVMQWYNNPLPQAPLPADDDPLLDRVEPSDAEGWSRAKDIRRAQYRRAVARILGETPPETA